MELLFRKTTFFVFKKHTFGYAEGDVDKRFLRLWIMAVDYMNGGDPQLLNNCILVDNKDLRLATLNDFAHFKVSSKGYEENPRYVFLQSNNKAL